MSFLCTSNKAGSYPAAAASGALAAFSVYPSLPPHKIVQTGRDPKRKDGRRMETTYLPEGQLLTTTRNREYTATLQGLERAMETGAIIEGTAILCDSELNLHIDFPALPGVRGIIPRTEAVWSHDGEPPKDIAILTRVGKAVACKVTGIEQSGETGTTVYLSRRLAQAECAVSYLEGLEAGDIIRGRVTHLESFGAFVDVGCGIPSLLSVDCISISRISHPRDRLYNGQTIWCAVRSIDRETGRIFVSTRELWAPGSRTRRGSPRGRPWRGSCEA